MPVHLIRRLWDKWKCFLCFGLFCVPSSLKLNQISACELRDWRCSASRVRHWWKWKIFGWKQFCWLDGPEPPKCLWLRWWRTAAGLKLCDCTERWNTSNPHPQWLDERQCWQVWLDEEIMRQAEREDGGEHAVENSFFKNYLQCLIWLCAVQNTAFLCKGSILLKLNFGIFFPPIFYHNPASKFLRQEKTLSFISTACCSFLFFQ